VLLKQRLVPSDKLMKIETRNLRWFLETFQIPLVAIQKKSQLVDLIVKLKADGEDFEKPNQGCRQLVLLLSTLKTEKDIESLHCNQLKEILDFYSIDHFALNEKSDLADQVKEQCLAATSSRLRFSIGNC
jgi:hypothetical protein